MTTEKINNFQRQLNLTMALMSAGRTGLTTEQILRTVPGYGYLNSPDDSDKKKVQRDRDDLRAVGIRLVESALNSSEKAKNYRYVIERGTFTWPANFKLTASQSRLLELAANCWRDSANENLDQALTRLVALGAAPDRSLLTELVPSFRPFDASFEHLSEAIGKQRIAEFKYRKPGTNEIETRTLAPWRFLNIEGEWLVQGWDYDRRDTRNFLLKRIVDKKPRLIEAGKGAVPEADEKGLGELTNPLDAVGDKKPKTTPAVAPSRPPFVSPTKALLDAADRDLDEFRSRNLASVRVFPGTAAWSHFEMDFETGDTKQLRYLDPELLSVQLRRYAGQVEVLEPAELVAEVRAGLEKVASAHA